MKTKTIKKKATVKKKAVSKKATPNKKTSPKKKPIHKGYIDIDYELKDGRSESVTWHGNLQDTYLIQHIAERVARLKLGDKLTIKTREVIK